MHERASSLAAPLLATVSFALVALVLQLGPATVKWPDKALALLVAAGLLMIGCIQAALWGEGKERGGWGLLSRMLYDSGTLALIAAIALVLVPPGTMSNARWTATCLASLGFLIELVWSAAAVLQEARGLHGIRDVKRWECAVDPQLTSEQKKSVVEALRSKGISTSRAAIKRMKKDRGGRPFGLEEVEERTSA